MLHCSTWTYLSNNLPLPPLTVIPILVVVSVLTLPLVLQEMLQYLDLSFNRIGARGLMRICEVMKTSRYIRHDIFYLYPSPPTISNPLPTAHPPTTLNP